MGFYTNSNRQLNTNLHILNRGIVYICAVNSLMLNRVEL